VFVRCVSEAGAGLLFLALFAIAGSPWPKMVGISNGLNVFRCSPDSKLNGLKRRCSALKLPLFQGRQSALDLVTFKISHLWAIGGLLTALVLNSLVGVNVS
jgi:hypothetical protein